MMPLAPEQISEALQLLNVAWSVIPGQGLVRVWKMPSFRDGFALATKLAGLISHYKSTPALLVTDQEVQLVITSGEGITSRDVALAEAIDKLLD